MEKTKLFFAILLFWVFLLGVIWVNFNDGNEESVAGSSVISSTELKENFENIVLSASVVSKPSSEKNSDPDSSTIITDKGDDLIVLINNTVRLAEAYEPGDLVALDGLVDTTKSGLLLRKEATKQLENMAKVAKGSGLALTVGSAYRSYWDQLATFSQKTQQAGLQSASEIAARPGYSQHQLGTAVDFVLTDPGQISWLEANGYKYGFVISYPEGFEDVTGYSYEPWHYRYIGVENAKKMRQEGLILEKYLQKYGVW